MKSPTATSCISVSPTNKNKNELMPKTYWEDVPLGLTYKTANHTVTKEEVIEFASEYDPQPFHLDEEAAKHSILGGLCASGWHTCALAMRLVYDAFLKDAAADGSPGVDEVRWRKPLYVGSTVHVNVECIDRRPSASKPDRGLVKWRWVMENQAGDTIMTLESWVMIRRRAGDDKP